MTRSPKLVVTLVLIAAVSLIGISYYASSRIASIQCFKLGYPQSRLAVDGIYCISKDKVTALYLIGQ